MFIEGNIWSLVKEFMVNRDYYEYDQESLKQEHYEYYGFGEVLDELKFITHCESCNSTECHIDLMTLVKIRGEFEWYSTCGVKKGGAEWNDRSFRWQ